MFARMTCRLLGAGSAALLALSVPAIAQAAPPAEGSDLPTCSKTITDHCMQRGGHQEAMMGHYKGHHGNWHHKGGRHHHRHHRKGHHGKSHQGGGQ